MKMFMIFWLNLRRGLDEAEDVEDLSNWMQLSHARALIGDNPCIFLAPGATHPLPSTSAT